jgi:hypothetical protein
MDQKAQILRTLGCSKRIPLKRKLLKKLKKTAIQNLKTPLLLGDYTSLKSASVSKKKTRLSNSPNASSYAELPGVLWTRQLENHTLTSQLKKKK